MKSKLFLAGLGLALAGGVFWYSIDSVSAQDTSASWVSTLAQKLGVSEDKVQVALDEMRTQKQVEMQARLEERLSQAVTAGEITDAQKQAILARHQEMQTKRETERAEWQNWLKDNGLDNVNLGFGFGGHFKMGRGMHGW